MGFVLSSSLTEFSHPPLAPGHIDAPHRFAPLGDLRLESGETIKDYRQSYVTHGVLDADRKNAVLICSAITGTHHRLDFLIGEGKALDPSKYFIVATDPIGNGLSTSPSNSAKQPGMHFPRFAVRDMVDAQRRLLTEHLGLERIHAVVGASMGGMQALQWATSHPEYMGAVVAMTPMARTAPWAAVVLEAARACLTADPAWNGSAFESVPERGWRAWTCLMQGLVMRTPESLVETGGADGAEAWLDAIVQRQGAQGVDATDFLYQSWAYQAHDLGTTPGFSGNTNRALASIQARTLVLAPPLDLFNPVNCAREAAAVIPGASFVEIPSAQGHSAATSLKAADADFLNRVVGEFLAA